jgi:hypothetical protein
MIRQLFAMLHVLVPREMRRVWGVRGKGTIEGGRREGR